MALFTAIQHEMFPTQIPLEGPMLPPVSMLEASKTKNSGVITMNSAKGASSDKPSMSGARAAEGSSNNLSATSNLIRNPVNPVWAIYNP